MPDRFYIPDALAPGPMSITGPEAHHIAHVLRLKPGEEITLFNGDGCEYPARLDLVRKSHLEVSVLQVRSISREAPRAITIACPLPKGDRAAFLIEKLTELGVSRFIPLRTQRSVVHPGEGKIEKLQRQVIEACKQCGRNVLMSIEPLTDWSQLLLQPFTGQRWLADATGSSIADLPRHPGQPLLIAFGPEGGWTPDELSQARLQHWHILSLARSILRIETAALAAATLALNAH